MGIKQIIVDVDGVLTDGKQYIDHTGEKLFKAFNSRDIRAIREFVASGIDVILVTADDWEGLKHWAFRVGANIVVTRDKFQYVKEMGFHHDETVVVGDDAWDVEVLSWGRAYCPDNSDESVIDVYGICVMNSLGGEGVMAELVRIAETEGWL